MPLTMGYYTRDDIPFITPLPMHLPFVISISVLRLRAQHQNRLYFWSGTIRPAQNENARQTFGTGIRL